MQMIKNITRYVFPILAIIILFSSCKKEYETIESIDDAKIQTYIKANNLNATKDASGFYYQINEQGIGGSYGYSDTIYYAYKFKTLSGALLNESSELSIPGELLGYTDRFVINNNKYSLTPIREVFAKLNRGGKATLIMPSKMAFGKNGIDGTGISANEIILVELSVYKKHERDDFMIKTFMTKNNLTMTKLDNAYYNVSTPGSSGGQSINLGSTLTAKYTVKYLSGTVIQSNTDGTFVSELLGLYKGWQLILPGRVTKGGKLRMLIPSALGDGTTPLDFEIEIVDVTN
jgi:FKBP-type peptidyl-prolyl cis-trans isomerase FkpA